MTRIITNGEIAQAVVDKFDVLDFEEVLDVIDIQRGPEEEEIPVDETIIAEWIEDFRDEGEVKDEDGMKTFRFYRTSDARTVSGYEQEGTYIEVEAISIDDAIEMAEKSDNFESGPYCIFLCKVFRDELVFLNCLCL